MQDLCYVPDRLDSWAGMALARMSRLDVKLAAVSRQSVYQVFILGTANSTRLAELYIQVVKMLDM